MNKVFFLILSVLAILGLIYYLDRVSNLILLSERDSISQWTFQGPYNDSGFLENQVKKQINDMEKQLAYADYKDQELLITISNKYSLLGDGKNSYRYLLEAVENGGAYDGLAWNNMANVLSKLNAKYSALIAHEKAVISDPKELTYHLSRIGFVTEYFSSDTLLVDDVFSDAEKVFPNNQSLLQLRIQWLAR